jgi:hypothetical protein
MAKSKKVVSPVVVAVVEVPAVEVEAVSTRSKISAGVAASWTKPEVRAARRQRSAVEVDGTIYPSVYKAFLALDLPVSVHIPFRGELKAKGEMSKYGHEWKIIPINY